MFKNYNNKFLRSFSLFFIVSFFQIITKQKILCLSGDTVGSMMDLDQLDPDWEFALMHGEASKVGIRSKNKKILVCRCCLNAVFKDRLPLCENSKELELIGFGFPLYYVFFKYCILLLLLLICTYSAISLFWAFQHNYEACHPRDHTPEKLGCATLMIRIARIEANVPHEEQVLRMLSFLIHLCYLIYMRNNIVKLEAYYDERTTSLTDYCVIMKNIPQQKKIQQKIKSFFQHGFQQPHIIKHITLIPEYDEIKILTTRKMRFVEQMRPFYTKKKFDSDKYLRIKQEINIINEAIRNQAERINNLAKQDKIKCEKVILAFNTDEEKSKIIDKFQQIQPERKRVFFGVKAEDIILKQAPEPKEIIWQNFNTPKEYRALYKVIGWFLSILVLLCVAVIFSLTMEQITLRLDKALENQQQKPDNSEHQRQVNLVIVLFYVVLILIVLLNKFLMVALFYKFTDVERNDTSSKYQFSFGFKYCLGLFFTTALMILFVEALSINNYTQMYGVVDLETIMFFLNAVCLSLFWIVNPFQIIRRIKRAYYRGRFDMTQREANLLMEDSEYEIGKRYAEIIQTIWFTIFYASVIPVGAFLSICGLFVYYWVDKWNLLRRSTVLVQVQGKLVRLTMTMLDFSLLLKPMGEVFFDYQIRNQVVLSSILMTILGFFYVILPINRIIQCFYSEKFHLQQKTYEEVKHRFKDTYRSLHPAYMAANETKMNNHLLRAGFELTQIKHKDQIENIEPMEINLAVNQTQDKIM